MYWSALVASSLPLLRLRSIHAVPISRWMRSSWISWSVRAEYFSRIVCIHSSLVGSGGTNDIPDSLLWLIEKPPSDMIGEWRGSGCFSLDISSPFYRGGGVVGDRF